MGTSVSNWLPVVSATTHHGQGDGTSHQWVFRLHWANEDIDEEVAMAKTYSDELLTRYVNGQATAFGAVFGTWLASTSASTKAKAKAADFAQACWAWVKNDP